MSEVSLSKIEKMIYVIRGQKVMLDSDLAELYGVERNIQRFPVDFTFQLTEEEALRGVTITAHSVLYGAIRETVAWLTGRQVYGSLLLGLSVLRNKKQEAKVTELVDAVGKPSILTDDA